jgi:type IV pilus assembly protein PilB
MEMHKTHITRADPRKLGEIIAQYTKVTNSQIKQAIENSLESGLQLGEQLVTDGSISEEELAKCLSVQWGLPFVDLRHSKISMTVVELVEAGYQRKSGILLLQLKGGILACGILDPLKVDVLDEVRLITGYDIRPMVVSKGALEEKYKEIWGLGMEEDEENIIEKQSDDDVQDVLHKAEEMGIVVEDKREDDIHQISNQATGVDDMPVIKLVNSILSEGIRRGSSDIHLQPEKDRLQVRYRVDGILQDGTHVPRGLMRVVTARIKVMAGLDFSNRMSPQDGRMSVKIGKRGFECRVSVLPSVGGSKVVMRIAEQSDEIVTLDELGFDKNNEDRIRGAIKRPYGMVLITGPTGSGKSTTLYACLNEVNTPAHNILTVEDPVETQVEGVTQAEINERGGLSFSACLRAALRQEPDIIMVGEIRDTETAKIAIEASLTGHLVLSTLHTNDAPSAVTRLIDMDVQPFLVASSLVGVQAQRLVRRVCSECCQDYNATVAELEGLTVDMNGQETVVIKRPGGCETCNQTGYKGRVGIFEVLVVTDALKLLVLKQESDSAIRDLAREEGMMTLVDDVSQKLMAQLTTLEEAQRVVFF